LNILRLLEGPAYSKEFLEELVLYGKSGDELDQIRLFWMEGKAEMEDLRKGGFQ
jgi:hypothetical protein